MHRRSFLAGLASVAAAPLAAAAQPPGRIPRIGYLDSGSPPAALRVDGLRQGLRELGYVEGQSIAIEYRWAEGNYARLPDLAAELVRLNVNVIVSVTTPAARAAKQATTTVPIVAGLVADPVRSGIVPSLARPGGNITGWTHLPGPEFAPKRLEVLREVIPSVTRVAVLWNPANPAHEPALKEITAAARTLGLHLELLGARDAEELEKAFSRLVKQRAEALYLFPDGLFDVERARIVTFAAKSRLPAMYGTREFSEAGGLLSYGANVRDLYRRTAYFVDKILRGTRPADLPIEQPTKFDLVVNVKTARALGLTIPPSLLLRADQVIE